MILVTGPTGSGKTVSLYTCLNLLNKPGVNIATAEDPSEINLPGVNQVNVNEKAGLTFAAALKSFLRQDPDIIMVGEIRDLETADISIKAAQTGHMVLSTLHTNDAPTTLTRMMQHGHSHVQHRIQRDPDHRAALGAAPLPDLQGTTGCAQKRRWLTPASRKRLGWHLGHLQTRGLLSLQQRLQGARRHLPGHARFHRRDPAHHPARRQRFGHCKTGQQVEGVRTLRESGLLKVKLGLTSLEEVLSVTNE